MTRKKSAKQEKEIAAKAEDVIPSVPLALLEANPQLPSKESVLEYFALHYAESQERIASYGTGAARAAIAFEPVVDAGIDLETLSTETAVSSNAGETLFSASLEESSFEATAPVEEDSIFGGFDFEENVQRDPNEGSGLLSVSTESESFGGDIESVTYAEESDMAFSFNGDAEGTAAEEVEAPVSSEDEQVSGDEGRVAEDDLSELDAEQAALMAELAALEAEEAALLAEQAAQEAAFEAERQSFEAEQAAQEAAFEAEREAFETEQAEAFEERMEAAVQAEAQAEAESEVIAELEHASQAVVTEEDLSNLGEAEAEAGVAAAEEEPAEEATMMFTAVTDEMLAEMEAKQGEKKKRSRKKRT